MNNYNNYIVVKNKLHKNDNNNTTAKYINFEQIQQISLDSFIKQYPTAS